ncbi:GRAM protein, partial [Pachycephala philippinensis]|nr:GRAM protein [Pachycephala philippinensis]
PTLQELEVTVMDARMCNNSRFWKGTITSTMICFQGRCPPGHGGGPCPLLGVRSPVSPLSPQGDSGSPLVCGKRPAVAGVMSFSSEDPTDPLKPPVATSTVKYKKWIQKTLR